MPDRPLLLAGLVAVLVVAVGGVTRFLTSAAVEVEADGQVHTTRTWAGDVRAVLDRLDLEVSDDDQIDPPLSAPVEDGLRVVVRRAITVDIEVDDRSPSGTDRDATGEPRGEAPDRDEAPGHDGLRSTTVRAVLDTVVEALHAADLAHVLDQDAHIRPSPRSPVADGDRIEVILPATVTIAVDGEEQQVETHAERVGRVLREADLDEVLLTDPRPRIDPPVGTVVADGDRIELELPITVTITADGDERTLSTHAGTVEDVLDEAEVSLGDRDRIDPDLGTPVEDGSRIAVERVQVVEGVEAVVLAHGETQRETDELPAGETRVDAEGQDGLRRDTVAVTFVDGEEIEREVVAEEVVRAPTDRVVLVGTAEPVTEEPPADEPVTEEPPADEPVSPPPADGAPIHLTFDDGPNPTYTPQVLDLLAQHRAQATFFVVGQWVADHPDVAQRIVDEGHVIANHTWSHERLEGVSREVFDAQVGATEEQIATTTGRPPACLRPPYGATDGTTAAWAADHGLSLQLWDVDPRDWEQPGTDAIAEHVVDRAGPGAVVLLHDGFQDRAQTVAALDRILTELSAQGYTSTAVPGC
jgi:peptidoglycan-N-acetylglucosamine deacetylase